MTGWILLTYISIGSLIGLTGLRQLFFAPLGGSPGAEPLLNVAWFLLQILPILLTMPGVIRNTVRSNFMLCLASLLYFIHGVLVCFDSGWLAYGLVEITFSLALCTTTAVVVRKLREANPAEWGKD